METKSCQNCHKEFTIDQEDFSYYEKINVPPPTWCPECRVERRMSFVNTWSIYWGICSNCGVKTLSEYSPKQEGIIFCQKCWWSDSWDGTEYGMDYDPSRTFFDQLKELSLKTPRAALESQYSTLKNCEYTNGVGYSKDCFMIFYADYCEHVYYSSILNGLKWSSDCIRGWDSELCYDAIGFIRNFRVFFSDECNDCVDVWFSRNCYNCTNCVGCVNLRGESNCIFNVKYSKGEYQEKIKELGLDSWSKLKELEKKARDFWLSKPQREYHGHSLNVNVTGEYAYESKNSKEGYIMNYAENSKWCQMLTVPSTKDCYDYSGWGSNASRLYESIVVGENADSIYFSSECWGDIVNMQYSDWVISGKNNFGCMNLKRKQYCILNKEYSKQEFEVLKNRIIEDMKVNPYIDEKGRIWPYGEFFPLTLSKFAYNKSNAMRFFPKTKDQALLEGYAWEDEEIKTSVITLTASLLPDTIKETDDSVLNEVLGCLSCGNGYKIVRGELDLLRKMGLPIPHECYKCRETARFARLNKPGMYHRTCAKCNANIYTPYAPERPEIVYCVKCYQAEFA